MTRIKSMLSGLKRLGKIAILAVAVLAVIGFIYERVGEWQDRKRIPQP